MKPTPILPLSSIPNQIGFRLWIVLENESEHPAVVDVNEEGMHYLADPHSDLSMVQLLNIDFSEIVGWKRN